MVKVESLVKRYGNLVALDHLNLEINEGEIFGRHHRGGKRAGQGQRVPRHPGPGAG